MARSWHYPRWRGVVMQVTLWVIFGATVAMAEWAVHERSPAAAHHNGPRVLNVEGLTIQLPDGWDVTPGDSPDVTLQAEEHSTTVPDAEDSVAGRTLIVQQFPARPNESAQQFLATGGALKNVLIISNGADAENGPNDTLSTRPILIDQTPGAMVEALRAVTVMPGQPAARAHEWIACAIEPDAATAIVLRLQRFMDDETDPSTEPDDVLLSRLAGAIRFHSHHARLDPQHGP